MFVVILTVNMYVYRWRLEESQSCNLRIFSRGEFSLKIFSFKKLSEGNYKLKEA